MILDHHQISPMEGSVHTPCGIGEKQNLRSHKLHQPNGKHHITDGIALIVMHPALHAGYGNLIHVSENKFPRVARHRGHGETLYLPIGKLILHLQRLRIVPQTGAQHQGYLWHEIRPPPHAVQAV